MFFFVVFPFLEWLVNQESTLCIISSGTNPMGSVAIGLYLQKTLPILVEFSMLRTTNIEREKYFFKGNKLSIFKLTKNK